MNSLKQRINEAKEISEKTRKALSAIENSIVMRDIPQQAMYFLEFEPFLDTPFVYKNMIVDLYRVLMLDEARKVLGGSYQDYGLLFNRLFSFFECLDGTDFEKNTAINYILNNTKFTVEQKEQFAMECLADYKLQILQ